MGPKNFLIQFVSVIILLFGISGCKNEVPSEPKKVNVLFTASGLGDLSFNDNLYKGVIEAYDDFDFEVEYAFPATAGEAAGIMHQWVDSLDTKEVLIILLGHEYQPLVELFEGNFNQKKVLLIDAGATQHPDLISMEFSFYGAAFQAGVAASKVTLIDTIGVIAGMDIPPIANAIAGYNAGFLYAQGQFTRIQYIDSNFSGFQNIEKAALLTEEMYNSVNVIFGIAGYANLGIFETLRKKQGMFAIGVDQDQSWLCLDKIIGSVVKQIDKVAYNIIRDFMNNEFKPGYYLAGLETEYMRFVINPVFDELLGTATNSCYNDALQAESAFLQNNLNR